MNILLIHQNFPGQYKHLGPALAAQGHRVVALTMRVKERQSWQGVEVFPYGVGRGTSKDIHPWLSDFETKLLRAEACYDAALDLRDDAGFVPDVILAHPSWGESLFLRDVWPGARIGLYCELYYLSGYPHMTFDAEFPAPTRADKEVLRLRMKNLNNMVHFGIGDAGISPTRFQADTFPAPFRDRIAVIHDGVDTQSVQPRGDLSLTFGDGTKVVSGDEVITFVNRRLEPTRGYHVFMRALPGLLRARPGARVLIVGEEGVSYGAQAPGGKSWKQTFIDEVRGQIPDEDWARVHFLGQLPYDQFIAVLQVSRLHVYLTYPFVLSWSLLEAMSVAAPILASDTAPVREVITDGETGRLVDFFDTDALVAAADEMLSDPALAARLGAAARAHVVAGYDLHRICLPRQLAWVAQLADMAPLAVVD